MSNTRAYFLNHQAILPPFSFSSSFDVGMPVLRSGNKGSFTEILDKLFVSI